MAENIFIDKNKTDEEIYEQVMPQLEALINPDEPVISSLSNITALLKDAFDKISWVGFYLTKGDKLYLGPFQGKVACTVIKFGNGVCGAAAVKRQTEIVKDVEEFPGHIACDAGSRSEIVVPLIENGDVYGVLDVDSYDLASFNATDKKYLQRLCTALVNKLNFGNFGIS